ncbi:MAG: Rrf2 family transcriptional regulator [Bacteroidota bacterium]|jgi:Rrf2 family protein
MFQLSKKVEYGLIAIRHMASGPPHHVFTAKEIADAYHISYELLAKVMQKLAKQRFIGSHQGVHGGYTLLRDPHELKVSSIINAIEGKLNVTIVQCEAKEAENCAIYTSCTIKYPLVKLQGNINKVFEEMTVMEMV